AAPCERAPHGPPRRAMMGAMVSLLLALAVLVTGLYALNSALAQSEGADDSAARRAFETRWNNLHRIRTALSTGAFALLVAAAV
ncbi:anthrone oxygenase family protein, partial [Streptomyces sp. NPDC058231]|uniref:anthrone oxygenase family protein n=1 Tax=Streptomyces sp. NPDC058231 TaxID=3346392 RepID=UPI0036F0E4E0